MYELLGDVRELPINEEEFVSVRQGMNKINISVGQHISEPSQVFLVTGRAGEGYSTFAVFYLMEPRIHVIYGHDANPYDHSLLEQVEQEGTEFLEEMGAIVEEVDWAGMSSDSRGDWLAQTHLIKPEDVVEVIESDEIIEEVEEIEEVVAVDDAGEPTTDAEVEVVSTETVEPTDEETLKDESLEEAEAEAADEEQEPAEPKDAQEREEGDDGQEEDPEGFEDEDGGDEDEEDEATDPLKEAFLKPSLKKKTTGRPRVRRVKPSEVEAELERDALAEEAAAEPQRGTEETRSAEDMEDDLYAEAELNRAEEEILSAAETGAGHEDDPFFVQSEAAQEDRGARSQFDEETATEILRFLSKI